MVKAGEVTLEGNLDSSKIEEGGKSTILKIGGALSKAFSGINGLITTAGIGVLAGISISLTAGVKAAVEFEDAFAMVKKTMAEVDDPRVFEKIANDLKTLATQIPVRATELAALGSVAGQLGVKAEDVNEFVEVVGKLSVATNLTGTQAATSLARFLNVTNQTTDQVGKMGAILVQLGNNVAAQESEIILLAQNFGAIGTVAGLSAEDILAFSAAMRETGQQASAGSTALGKLFTLLADAGKMGGGDLANFAEVAGVPMAQFAEILETDVAKATQMFLKGLKELNDSGAALNPTLQKLGLNQVRTARAVLSLANNYEGLDEALKLAREEAISQNALNEEAATRFETVSQKVNQFKSIMNVASSNIGELFLPVVSKLMDFFITLARGLVGLVRGFKELSTFMKTLVTTGGLALVIKSVKNLIGVFKGVFGIVAEGSSATGALGMLKNGLQFLIKPLKLLAGWVGIVVAAIAGLFALGKKQEAFDAFNEGVKSIGNSIEELGSMEGGIADNLTDDIVYDFVEKIPEGFREGVRKAVNDGQITADSTKAAIAIGDVMSKNITDKIRNGLSVGDMFDGVAHTQLTDALAAMDMEGGVEVFGEIYEITKLLRDELQKGKLANQQTVEILKSQLAYYTAIAEASGEIETDQEKLNRLIKQTLGIQVSQEAWVKKMLETDAGRLSLAERLKDQNKEIYDLLVKMGYLNPVDPISDALNQLTIDANNFKQLIEDLKKPGDLVFDMEISAMEVDAAHREHNKLHEESKELHQENIDLQQQLIDLQNAEILLAEEVVEIAELNAAADELALKHKTEAVKTLQEQKREQDLINEALEIEERLRNGLALSANDQLQREKLRKDRRRVELAVAQGSLEFADLELAAIDENIKAIEDKAVTQLDADIAREKVKEINQSAEARREKEIAEIEKMRNDALQIAEDAQKRRNEEIEAIEKRRVEINERLLELPLEIKRAHKGIHDAQMAVIDANVKLLTSFGDLRSIVVEDAIKMAKALGMPLEVLQGIMTLSNHAQKEAVGKVNDRIQGVIGGDYGISVTNSNYTNRRTGQFGKFENQHIGGMLKNTGQYRVGELGPEILKMNPSGGGFIQRLDQDGRAGMGGAPTIVNVNVTGLPTDPIAARRIAQNIQRELNKLAKDGRSGAIR